MRSRSWMAAWALGAGIVSIVGAGASMAAEPVINQVALDLQISGLASGEFEVEIAPGHASCRFAQVTKRMTSPGASARVAVPLDLIVVETISADRECAFAITIREAGQEPRTFRRGLRLASQLGDRPVPVQNLNCFLSAPSLAAVARGEGGTPRR